MDELIARAKNIFGAEKVEAKLAGITNKLKIFVNIPMDDEALKNLLNDIVYPKSTENLHTKYIMPPFSYLDTKTGEWQRRKSIIDDYVGSSLVGRAGGLAYGDIKIRDDDNGTSQFDSLLCEILLKWFGFKGCNVVDVFAGGHIRGIMAALLGYNYVGTDLNGEQIDANIATALQLNLKAEWYHDDGLNIGKYAQEGTQDLFFTCPPYGDLEKYTDDARDLSNMDYAKFMGVYAEIISRGCKLLKPNRFAVIVVSDFRDEKGFYRGFVKDTIIAFQDAGLKLYNEIILLNNIGSAPMRASLTFKSRKVIRLHQNVLVFVKGDVDKDLYTDGVDSRFPFEIKKQSAMF